MSDNVDFNMDLLDRNLSDIEDLPSFEVPPQGTYTFLANAATKMVNDHPAVSLDLEVVETIALAKSEDKPPVPGSKFNTLYMLDNEFGLGALKQDFVAFAEAFGTDNLRTLVSEKVQQVVIAATLKHRKDKKDPDRVYPVLKNITIK